MKGYRRFIAAFVLVLVLYVLAEMNRPKPVDWKVTLSKEEKTPYGSYVLYQQLKDLFPKASVNAYRQPVYNQVNNFKDSNTAYLLTEPSIDLSRNDMDELLNYVVTGNYVFIASGSFSNMLMDTLGFKTARRFDAAGDSGNINLIHPRLQAPKGYGFRPLTLDHYFSRLDTLHSYVLGNNRRGDVNFIRIPYGDGAFLIHTLPLCFSNYFMLTGNNATYTAGALSYLPAGVKRVYWDEYYKLGPRGSDNPLRFILNNAWLRWSFRVSIAAMLLFLLFETKRRQRVIPVIEPPPNSTLDFVKTVGSVYFNQHNNKNIALKKINYFLEFVRTSFLLSTSQLNDEFVIVLAKKSGVSEKDCRQLVNLIYEINESGQITDAALVDLGNQIDSFYAKAI